MDAAPETRIKDRPVLRFLTPLLFFALLTGCSSPSRYKSVEQVPGAPRIDSIFATTLYDTTACLRINFSDTNTLPVTFRIERTGPGGSVFSTRVYGIPAPLRFYCDAYPDSFPQAYNAFQFRMVAATLNDSLSPASPVVQILLLDQPPIIDSVVTSAGYPVVYYRLLGGRGNEWTVQIVKNDSVIAQTATLLSFGDWDLPASFPERSLDSLRARWPAGPSENNTFGVRITVRVLKAQAIAVSRFRIRP